MIGAKGVTLHGGYVDEDFLPLIKKRKELLSKMKNAREEGKIPYLTHVWHTYLSYHKELVRDKPPRCEAMWLLSFLRYRFILWIWWRENYFKDNNKVSSFYTEIYDKPLSMWFSEIGNCFQKYICTRSSGALSPRFIKSIRKTEMKSFLLSIFFTICTGTSVVTFGLKSSHWRSFGQEKIQGTEHWKYGLRVVAIMHDNW